MIVERVDPASAAEQVGLRPRDRLLAYQGHPLLSPAALQAWEENTFGFESVRLQGERDGQSFEFAVRQGRLGIEVRPDLPAVIHTQYERGREAFTARRYREAALRWSETALVVQDTVAGAWLYGKMGAAWECIPDWHAAQSAYERADHLLQGGDDTATRAMNWVAIGHCCENHNEFEAAIQWYQRAHDADVQAGRFAWIARDLNSLGRTALLCGDLISAQAYFNGALDLGRRFTPDTLELAATFNGLGRVAYYQGGLIMAQSHFVQALTIREQSGPDSKEVANSLNNLGAITADLGDLVRAKDYHIRALAIREHLDAGSADVAMSVMNLGGIAYYEGDTNLARSYFLRSLEIYERLDSGSLSVANSLDNLGLVAADVDDLAVAKEHHLRALAIRERLAPDSMDVSTSLFNLGSVALKCDDLRSAQDLFTRTLDICERRAFDSLDHADSLEGLGRLALCRNQPNKAAERFRQAIEIVEGHRAQIASPQARALLLARHTHKYAGLIGSYLALKDVKAAFTTLERARARSMLELLADRNLDLAIDAQPELLRQQQELNEQRAHVSDQLTDLATIPGNDTNREHLRRTLRELEHRQQALAAQMRAESPHYASLQYPQPLACNAAQATLEPGTLLLSYLVDEEQTFLFAVTNDTIVPFILPIGRTALQSQVSALRDVLNRNLLQNRTGQAAAKAVELGRQLYVALVRPAVVRKRGGVLLLCPDGPLHTLPFGALVTNSRGRPRYLGTGWPLHSILSVTIHAQTMEESASTYALKRVLAFGDPLYSTSAPHAPSGHPVGMKMPSSPQNWGAGGRNFNSGSTPALARSGEPSRNDTSDEEGDGVAPDASSFLLPPSSFSSASDADPLASEAELALPIARGPAMRPLPHTRAEALCLARLFGKAAVVKLGSEATKTAALMESAEADIVHFACHAWFDPKMPLSSGLALSQPDAMREQGLVGDNGLLQAWEIFQKLRLKADLVVLSACQTGLGQEVRGEGLVGLTRAFQYAGAKSLVVSLWEVDDESTPVFMEAFYTALKAGVSKDEALQEGARALQSHPRWSHPYYWSAFVLIGNRSSIQ